MPLKPQNTHFLVPSSSLARAVDSVEMGKLDECEGGFLYILGHDILIFMNGLPRALCICVQWSQMIRVDGSR